MFVSIVLQLKKKKEKKKITLGSHLCAPQANGMAFLWFYHHMIGQFSESNRLPPSAAFTQHNYSREEIDH